MLQSPPFIAVETAMFFGLGFLLALLLMLAFMPAVHRRAVRLTRRKYQPVPLEQKEMHAEKDRLRADFAMSTRKLEQHIDDMQRKAAAQSTELARRTESIAQLKQTLDARDTLIAQLQEQKAQRAAAARPADTELQALQADNAAKTAALAQANERIAALTAEIAALTAALDKRIRVYDSQQHEIMALASQGDVLRMQLAALAGQAAQARQNGGSQNGEGDVIRRALDAIEANGQGTMMPQGWAAAPSGGAVPFGH